VFLNSFDVLLLKINFKKYKNLLQYIFKRKTLWKVIIITTINIMSCHLYIKLLLILIIILRFHNYGQQFDQDGFVIKPEDN
jgi:hypothetical protein